MALDPSRQISQYAHTAWRTQDGDFSGTPHAITQTTDGYLWIGTEAGLVRFDGVRVVPWIPPVGKRLPSRRISSLLGASDGSLWIGTVRGLAHWKDGTLVDYPAASGYVESILQDPQGTVWIVRSGVRDQQGGLCKITGSGPVRCYGPSDGIPFLYVQAIARDPSGNVWVGSSTGICSWNAGSEKAYAYLPKQLERAKGLQGVSAIAAEPDGALWVGTAWTGKGLGLQRFERGAWKDSVVPGFNGDSVKVSALLLDHDGGLWVGTDNNQLFRIYKDKVDRFGSSDGLSSDNVSGFYEDREGDLWVVTTKGIDRFRDIPVATVSKREGLTTESVQSVLAANDGTVWIANVGALDFWRQGKLSAITKANGLPGRLVTSLFEDHSGRLWVGIDGGLTVYEQGRFRLVKEPNGKPLGVVVAITEDQDHDIWAAVTTPALLRIHNFAVQEEISPPRVPRAESLAADSAGGIWLGLLNGDLARYRQGRIETVVTAPSPSSGAINNLLVDSDGSLWAATGNGLLRWKASRTQRLDSRNGLPCDSINTVVADDRGSLWLDAACGYVAIARSELETWWQQPAHPVKTLLLDAFDGAQTGITHFRPTASRSIDGKLWFANQTILQEIDPSRLHHNDVAPPVHIEQVIADHKAYGMTGDLQLPALARDLEIDYTALSLTVPQKVRFHYQLEGRDRDWQDPHDRRQAFYTDLAPGSYRFHVIASNNDGVWNETGATMSFTILPAYYQTAWFRVLCGAILAFLLWLFLRLRLRRVAARMQTRLEERLAERERIARDLHDTLLQGFVSAYMQLDVANDRLPSDSPAKPLVQRVLALMKQVSEEGRAAIRSLRLPGSDGNDLEQVLARVQEEFASQTPPDFRIVVEGKPRTLHPVIREEVCRIAREAILNAFRHANASRIAVEIEYAARTLTITVRDNGSGIDAKMLQTGREGHWGLSNMRERAERIGAKLNLLSRPGAGTEVQLTVPGKVAFETTTSKSLWRWLTPWLVAKPKSDISVPKE
jgi:signal transduction histidine kinase/ligand-binding sensor domain-containing protein